MPPKIATALFKGGVGKTTITMNTAQAAVEILRRTDPDARLLIVDVDTQAGATMLLTGRTFSETDPTVSTLVTNQHTVDQAMIALDSPSNDDEEARAAWAGIDLIPASPTGKIRVSGPEQFWVLRDLLAKAELTHRLVLLDCGYGDTDMTLLGLVAADHILGVTTATILGANGIKQLVTKVTGMRRSFPHMRISGIIANEVVNTETNDQEVLAQLKEQMGDLLWEPSIPRRAIVKRSQTAGLPVSAFRSPAARDLVGHFTALATRILALEETP